MAVCAGGVTGQSGEVPMGSGGCGQPLDEPGDYEVVNNVAGVAQKYWLTVPDDYEDLAPLPLVLWLSSGGGNPDSNYAGWRPYLDDLDVLFAVVGTKEPDQRAPETLLALIDQIGTDLCIDTQRVHVMGESWSAATVGRLACAAPDRIASFLGGMGAFYSADCAADGPVPLIAVTGSSDRTGVVWSVEEWAAHNGCDPEPTVEDPSSRVTRSTYQNCEAEVVLYDIAGAGHSFVFHECVGPGAARCSANEDFDQLEEALRFFETHPLPASS